MTNTQNTNTAPLQDCTDSEFCARLQAVFLQNGLSALLTEKRTDMLLMLARRLVSENKKYNLTAITDTDAVILRHLADSLSVARLIPEGASVLDVGTGAGFPSLPLAVCRPDLSVTAMDATAKKVRYITETAALLGLTNYRGVAGRAEELCCPPMRQSFDVVVARAVSELSILSELCLPYCKKGGCFLAMKGTLAETEAEKARPALAVLGGGQPLSVSLPLHSDKEELLHAVICIKKEGDSPAEYPRPYAKILKAPLS